MKIWIASLPFLNRFPKISPVRLALLAGLLLIGFQPALAQHQHPDYRQELMPGKVHLDKTKRDTVPKPKSVMIKSAIIPGWGQIVNGQFWKVPIIYGAFAGLGWYSVRVTKYYHQFRAAYYNATASGTFHNDQRFGPTPAYLKGQSQSALKYYRNYYNNLRDEIYLGMGLVYGLNLLDAYVYAQLRDFNVSNNLSVQASIIPQNVPRVGTGVGLQLKFCFKTR